MADSDPKARSVDRLQPAELKITVPPVSSKGPLRVLLVEDEDVLLRGLKRYLGNARYHVDACATLEEAFTLLAQNPYAIVLTDLDLGGKSGLDLIARIKDLELPPATVLMSGVASLRDCDRATALGVNRVLCKPFTFEQVIAALEGAWERRRASRSNLESVSLTDVLQMLHQSRRSVTLKVGPGSLSLREGEVIHAECGPKVGKSAFLELLTTAGDVASSPLVEGPVSIRTPFQELLLGSLNAFDEAIGFAERQANADES